MTTVALPTFVRRAPRLQALRHAIADFLAGLEDGRVMAEQYRMLSGLTDGELAQRGLTRADIPRVVAKGLLRG
jgi:uncharacterized protein YjiS (DUF1127 family)